MTDTTRRSEPVWSDLAAEWTNANEVLPLGVVGVELDSGKDKLGDGVTRWAQLAYRSSGGSSSPALPVGIVRVDDQAGATDQAKINAAVQAAVAGAASSGSNYAEVIFAPRVYELDGALTKGGAGKTNALVPLPMVSSTAAKVTLKLTGSGEAAALPLGTQTVGQKSGTVLRTTVSSTLDGTYGEPSVIGGPTPAQGGGFGNGSAPLFTNLALVVDGIALSLPSDPHVCGLDLRGVAEVVLESAGVYVDAAVGSILLPTQAWQFGLAMPEARNNALCHIERFGVYGSNHGIRASEHTTADWFTAVCCLVGIAVGHAAGPHHARFAYACVELCQIGVAALGPDSFGYIDIDLLDYEPQLGGGFTTNFPIISLIDDSNYLSNFGNRTQLNKLQGTIRINNNGDPLYNLGPGPAGAGNDRVIGGGLLKVYCAVTSSGDPTKTWHLLQAVLPATGTPLKNPYYRDAAVTISGGTVSAVKVDGVALGVTSGTVIVPSGRTIEVDYTAAPSWVWSLI